jgi:glycosyltransferase involved in cell wall biosynthesis
MSRKKILILFPQQHIAYSPTTLGIYDALSIHADVTIFCPFPDEYKTENVGKRHFIFFKLDTSRIKKLAAVPAFILHKLEALVNKNNALGRLGIYHFSRLIAFKNALQKTNVSEFDEVIAVDVLMLFAAQRYCKQASFVSLELNDEEKAVLQTIPATFIKAVVIQNQQRYTFLFGEAKHQTFFVQNAPVFTKPNERQKRTDALVFNGTATPWFGLYHSLDFIKQYPQFSLTFKGIVLSSEKNNIHSTYKELIDTGKIIFNNEYTSNSDMLDFLNQFEIGFCFYDLGYPKMNTFNYRTAPSGKMFAYFAAGVPVIGNNIDGLKPVEEFEAGVLVNDFKPATILEAVNKIKSNYAFYQNNCYKAAAHFSFDKAIGPFVKELINN